MTIEEYKNKLQELEADFVNSKNKLKKEYAFSNAQYKVGDIITDHIGAIKVEIIMYDSGRLSEYPEAVYLGVEYTKKGFPKKSGGKRNVWQRNILTNS